MKPIIAEAEEKIVVFFLGLTTDGVTLNARDLTGQTWTVATVTPNGLLLASDISKSSGIPIDKSGTIKIIIK